MPNTYTKIASATVGAGGTSSVVFSSIPQTYTDLVLRASARSTRAGLDEDGFTIRLNSSTSGYTYKVTIGQGASIGNLNTSYEQTWAGEVNAGNSTANTFNNLEAYFPNYTGTAGKSYSVDSAQENNGSTAYFSVGAIFQSSTSAITSLTLGAANGNLAQYSTLTLYGIKNS
jgi:hypothetical protein